MQNMSVKFYGSCTIGNVSIQAILCVNTFSQPHAEEAATSEHYVGSDSVCLLQMWQMQHQVWQHQSPPYGTKSFPYFLPWARALCQDYSNKWWPQTTTKAQEADENGNDPENEYEYFNTETDNNIEIKVS